MGQRTSSTSFLFLLQYCPANSYYEHMCIDLLLKFSIGSNKLEVSHSGDLAVYFEGQASPMVHLWMCTLPAP